METEKTRLESAVKKVYAIRYLGYQYAGWVGGSIMIWALSPTIVGWVENLLGIEDEKFLLWLRLNILSIPFFILLILLGKTAWVYRTEIRKFFNGLKPKSLKRWEHKKIKEFMRSEE